MKTAMRTVLVLGVALVVGTQVGGCPSGVGGSLIEGSPGSSSQIRDEASVDVLTPASNLSITGGTQVEVNWQAFATTQFAVLDVFVDVDQDPDNDNEILAFTNLPLGESTALLDTTDLARGTYFVGVRLEEVGELVAHGYAPGTITIDQRAALVFTSPRGNFDYDRTERITPQFNVAWTLADPDSTNTVEIYLDPDQQANGNEILLYTSNAQGGDSFTFDLPTAAFEAGTYRILAVVSNGQTAVPFYAPGSIRLRARLAGYIDLRDIELPNHTASGAIFEGFNPRDNAGSLVASTGDIDLDGFGDIMIVAQFGKPSYDTNIQRTGIGEAYLVYGRQRRFSGVNNLNSTGTLYRGDIFMGIPEVDDPVRPTRGVTSFAVLSDWDRDGVREFAWGIPFVDSRPVGNRLEAYGSFRTGGVVISAGHVLRNFAGRQVLSLADMGTEPFEGPTDAECCEGFYGPHAPSNSCTYFHRHLFAVAVGEASIQYGARIWTNDFGDQCGQTVDSYDFDGLLISVPNRDPGVIGGPTAAGAGVVSLYYSSADGGFFLWDRANNDLPHGGPYHYVLDDIRLIEAISSTGSILRPASPGYFVDPDDARADDVCEIAIDFQTPRASETARFYGGFEGAGIGGATTVRDFNADGLMDILLGSPLSNEGAGSCFIILGRLPRMVQGNAVSVEEFGLPMNANDPQSQRVFDGIRVVGAPGDRLGQSQADAGDFNNDGISDVLIGSPQINNRRGGAGVFFGSREVINLTEEEIPFAELPDRGLGVIFEGEEEGDLAGARVCNAGDVDGDGNTDIMIAAPERSVRLDIDLDGSLEIDRTNCGVVYLIYGSPDLQGTLSLADVGTEALRGVVFIGRDSADVLGAGTGEQGDRSRGIASAGDVDGDGFDDLLLGSVKASPRDRAAAGETYLIYGVGE